jgi:hypothetical protein
MLEANEMKVLRKINEWVERRRRRNWDEHVTRMDAERLVTIWWDNMPAGKLLGRPKRTWSDLISD